MSAQPTTPDTFISLVEFLAELNKRLPNLPERIIELGAKIMTEYPQLAEQLTEDTQPKE